MNAVQKQQIISHPANIKLQAESNQIYDGFIKSIGPKGADSRAISIACIMLVSAAIADLPPELKFAMQEKFLKTFTKVSNAPFTFYKLGQ